MAIDIVRGTLPENTDLEYITKVEFSAASSVNVNDCFSSSYQHYLVTSNMSGTIANMNVALRLRVGGADDSGTNYRYQYVYAGSTSVSGSRATGQTNWVTFRSTENTAIGFSQLRISNPYETVRTTGWADLSGVVTGNIEMLRLVAAHDLATSYTGFTAIPSSGTITGTISVWGYSL